LLTIGEWGKVSDKTFGVKVSEELYDKVKMMVENSGSSSKEWFEKAVALTEVQDLKTGAPDYKQDLSELEVHTTRIYQLVSNMIVRAGYIKDDAVRELSEKLESREAIISSLQSSVKDLQERLIQSEEAAKHHAAEREELTKQLEEQRGINSNNQALIQEYKDKIDTLSSLVNQYKGYATENAELKETFATEKESMTAEFQQKESLLVSSIEELKATVHDQEDQINRLTEKLNSTIQENTKEVESIKVSHDNQLTQLTSQKDLEKERAILEVKQQYQEKLQEVHDQHNERLARLYEKLDTDTKKKPAADKK
jgi:chromosome segregation ATPase